MCSEQNHSPTGRTSRLTHDRAWHERRRLSGGASDLAVILGCSPYANADPLILAWEKRGELPIHADTDDRWLDAQFEDLGRRWLAHALGCEVEYQPERDDFLTMCTWCGQQCSYLNSTEPDMFSVAPDGKAEYNQEPCCGDCGVAGHAHANLDGRVLYQGREVIYEGKSIGWRNPDYDQWRRGGVPESVEWQVQQQLWCSGLEAALIVVHDAPQRSYSIREVFADPERHAFIRDAWAKWWQAAVVEKRNPTSSWSDAVYKAIKERWPDVAAGSEVMLSEHQVNVCATWLDAKATLGPARKQEKLRRTELLNAIGENQRGTLPNGDYLWRSVSSNGRVTLKHYKKGTK